jgi:hypothetical protein
MESDGDGETIAEAGMGGPARLRDRGVLERQIAALRAESGSGVARDDVDFRRGALAALRWVMEGGAGPLTGSMSLLPVGLAAIVKELAAAEDLIYGRPSPHREFARGVEHALMWAQFATAAPPLPPPLRPQPGPGSPPGSGPRWGPAAGPPMEAAAATWKSGGP